MSESNFDKIETARLKGIRALTEKANYTLYDASNESDALMAIERLKTKTYIAYDTETTGLNPADVSERLRLCQFATGDKAYIFDVWRVSKKVKKALSELLAAKSPMKIIHNASFDIKFSRADLDVYHFGAVFDTMLMQQIVNCGDINKSVALKNVIADTFGQYMSKYEQMSDWSRPKLSSEQLDYAARDVLVLEHLATIQGVKLREKNLLRIAKVENECAETVAAMELNGIYLDESSWLERDNRLRKRHEEITKEICDVLAPERQMLLDGVRSFNIDSKKVVKERLLDMGIQLPMIPDGKGGSIPTLAAGNLEAMIEKPKVIEDLIEYSSLQTSISRYGVTWIEHINSTSKRIHSYYRQIGAKTGRFSDSYPPKQQIPKRDEYRNCFMAQGRNTLVWGDYSQIELRIVAQYVFNLTDNRQMIEDYESGMDYHTITASRIYDIPIDEVTSDYRNPAKNMNFLMVYGGGSRKLAANVGISLEKAEWIVSKFFEVNPFLKITLDKLSLMAVRERQSRTLFGRVLVHRFNPHDKQMKASVERLGKNMPIQGTSADILKRALRLLHNEIGHRNIKLIHVVHDEVVLECPTKSVNETKKILERSMVKAAKEVLTDTPVIVDTKTGKQWSK